MSLGQIGAWLPSNSAVFFVKTTRSSGLPYKQQSDIELSIIKQQGEEGSVQNSTVQSVLFSRENRTEFWLSLNRGGRRGLISRTHAIDHVTQIWIMLHTTRGHPFMTSTKNQVFDPPFPPASTWAGPSIP